MKRAIVAAALLLAAFTTTAMADPGKDTVGTIEIGSDYNTIEIQDGPTTYKIGVEQLKKVLRAKAKEAYKDGEAQIAGTIEIKEPQRTISGNTWSGTSVITPYYGSNITIN